MAAKSKTKAKGNVRIKKMTAKEAEKNRQNARKGVLDAVRVVKEFIDIHTDPSLMDKHQYQDFLEELLTELEFRRDAVQTELDDESTLNPG